MENKPITEQLLELLKYYSADTLKAEQTKLTKAANQAKDVASGRLSVLFSAEERALLMNASLLMSSLKSRVERAKEVRQQEEEALKRSYELRAKKARQLVNAKFPLPTETTDDLMALAELFLALHEARVISYRDTFKAAKSLEESISENVGRLKRSARQAVLYYLHDCRSKLYEHVDFGDIAGLEARVETVVADLQDKALPRVRQQYRQTLDFVRTQLTIETTENVSRLKAGQAPGIGDDFMHLLAAPTDNVRHLNVGEKKETRVILKAWATVADMKTREPGVTYGPMSMETARPIIAEHELYKLPFKLVDEKGNDVRWPE